MTADGEFGPKTKVAVVKAQKAAKAVGHRHGRRAHLDRRRD
nr:hypothetical protein [Angustibacter aerolatus]